MISQMNTRPQQTITHTSHISGANLAVVDDVKSRASDVVGQVIESVNVKNVNK